MYVPSFHKNDFLGALFEKSEKLIVGLFSPEGVAINYDMMCMPSRLGGEVSVVSLVVFDLERMEQYLTMIFMLFSALVLQIEKTSRNGSQSQDPKIKEEERFCWVLLQVEKFLSHILDGATGENEAAYLLDNFGAWD